MKVITFLRHSKSSWDYEILDIHRPLSAVGIEKIKKTANSSKDFEALIFLRTSILSSANAINIYYILLIKII